MILITKEESARLRKYFPNVELHRTCKQKSKRHRIYCPCLERYMEIIADTNLEAAEIVEENNARKLARKKYFEKISDKRGCTN